MNCWLRPTIIGEFNWYYLQALYIYMYICMEVRLYDHDTYSTYAYACTHCTYGEEVYIHTHAHSCKTINIFEHALLWTRNEWVSWVFGLIEHNSMNYVFYLLTSNKSKSNSYSHSHICTQLVFICAILKRPEEE